MIKMLYNRCTGIYKFGNNTYPQRIKRRLNLGHIFREKKCVLWAGKYSIPILQYLPSGTNYEALHYAVFPSLLLLPPPKKDKDKVHPVTGHEGPDRDTGIALLFLCPWC